MAKVVEKSEKIASSARKHEGDGAERRKQHLVIGLDFGTAFTKIVIGEQRVKRAVPFNDYVSDGNPYLLPSTLSINKSDGACKLGFPGIDEYSIEDLKIKLIERNFSEEVKTRCAAFLSLVLRHARDWVEEMYHSREIVWYVNTGVPTASYEDEELTVVYKEIVRAAWMASFLPEEAASLARIGGCFDSANGQSLPDDRINIFPEFAVQLMGYIESPQRLSGLHILVDIGAGTLDLAIFNVHTSDGEDKFPIFTKIVKHLGTQFFIQNRLKNHAQPGWKPSPYENVPSATEFEKRLSLSSDELKEIDKPFQKKIKDLITEKITYTKNKRVPKGWNKNGTPTFLCGGGAKVDCYRKVFSELEQRSGSGAKGKTPQWREIFSKSEQYPGLPLKIRLLSLATKPEDLNAEGVAYDRLSVAYGLSLYPDNIAEIIKSQDIKDYEEEPEPSESSYTDRYVGSEQV